MGFGAEDYEGEILDRFGADFDFGVLDCMVVALVWMVFALSIRLAVC